MRNFRRPWGLRKTPRVSALGVAALPPMAKGLATLAPLGESSLPPPTALSAGRPRPHPWLELSRSRFNRGRWVYSLVGFGRRAERVAETPCDHRQSTRGALRRRCGAGWTSTPIHKNRPRQGQRGQRSAGALQRRFWAGLRGSTGRATLSVECMNSAAAGTWQCLELAEHEMIA